jgi:tRNA (mo5U34)-methyltransferase
LEPDELREEIRRLGPWHHDVEVAPGIRTGDAPLSGERSDGRTPTTNRPEVQIWNIVNDLFPNGLGGRSFLDCACNGGGHSLFAARMGAGRCFGFDARKHWIDQALFLKRFAPHQDMDFQVCSLGDLPGLGLDPFDVTLFSGIFYHLPDPVAGLKAAADLTGQLLVLNTAAMPGEGNMLRLMMESPDDVMDGVDGLAWLPSGPDVLERILSWCGFRHTRVHFDRPTAEGWSRIQILAAREAALFEHYDGTHPPEARTAAPGPGIGERILRRLGLRQIR